MNQKNKEKKKHSRYKTARRILIFWCLFIGSGAVAGAYAMLIQPDGSLIGMQEMIPYFQVLPLAKYLYQDFLFPGIALLCVNGLTNLTAAILLLRRKKAGIICGMIFGFTLMAWITIQFVIFPANAWSISYFFFGILQAATGYATWVFYQQEHFTVDEADYPNIGTNPKELVIYFSRMGYTKRAALEAADQCGGMVYEIRAKERTEGTLGFWWCGRFGMHRWEMPVEEVSLDLSAYEHVTICTPVWVFHLAAPVRAFCKRACGQIKNVDYILVHYQKSRYFYVAQEMNQLLGIKANHIRSICSRKGKVEAIYEA